jgi:hypothetical protein
MRGTSMTTHSKPYASFLAVQLDIDSESTELLDGEVLHIGSVKHSIDDPADCRYKLVRSVSAKDLTLPYVAQQLRVLSGRLESTGINGRRVYLFLQDFPDDDHVAITITGAVDVGRGDEFLEQMEHLPHVVGARVCRHLLFDHIDDLHELVDDD